MQNRIMQVQLQVHAQHTIRIHNINPTLLSWKRKVKTHIHEWAVPSYLVQQEDEQR